MEEFRISIVAARIEKKQTLGLNISDSLLRGESPLRTSIMVVRSQDGGFLSIGYGIVNEKHHLADTPDSERLLLEWIKAIMPVEKMELNLRAGTGLEDC